VVSCLVTAGQTSPSPTMDGPLLLRFYSEGRVPLVAAFDSPVFSGNVPFVRWSEWRISFVITCLQFSEHVETKFFVYKIIAFKSFSMLKLSFFCSLKSWHQYYLFVIHLQYLLISFDLGAEHFQVIRITSALISLFIAVLASHPHLSFHKPTSYISVSFYCIFYLSGII
jgi:hypothetical protein